MRRVQLLLPALPASHLRDLVGVVRRVRRPKEEERAARRVVRRDDGLHARNKDVVLGRARGARSTEQAQRHSCMVRAAHLRRLSSHDLTWYVQPACAVWLQAHEPFRP